MTATTPVARSHARVLRPNPRRGRPWTVAGAVTVVGTADYLEAAEQIAGRWLDRSDQPVKVGDIVEFPDTGDAFRRDPYGFGTVAPIPATDIDTGT